MKQKDHKLFGSQNLRHFGNNMSDHVSVKSRMSVMNTNMQQSLMLSSNVIYTECDYTTEYSA